MERFNNFLTTNGIRKKEIASFLGVSNAFVTQLCTGRSKLTPEKTALIKANRKGWDTSMLTPIQVSAVGTSGTKRVSVVPQITLPSTSAAVKTEDVRKDFDRLWSLVEDQRNDIKTLMEMIRERDAEIARLRKELDAREKGNASIVDLSSDADAI